ncbi:MAG: ribosomal RNA small subunit methyltransferase A [Candidatus Sumerlaeia bacterium]|nr:ribosomal RNA small subunit methyltransferase A [Candidatus Sumerlaeia bacterium]
MNDETTQPLPAPQDFPNMGELLRRMGVWLDKRKGQHYLRDQSICRDISLLCEAGPDDTIVEIGAGTGNLSIELAVRAGSVISVELDDTFSEWHSFLMAGHPSLKVLYGDFLEKDLEDLVSGAKDGGRLIAAGNLPYQVTSEILFRFVKTSLPFTRMVFMVQREVAERIAIGPANRLSGALTYKIALSWDCEIAFHVEPDAFLPPPRVQSSVIVLERKAEPLYVDIAHRERIYTLLENLFRFRRKTLSNGLLMSGQIQERAAAEEILLKAGIEPKRRVETLTLQEIIDLEACLVERRRES